MLVRGTFVDLSARRLRRAAHLGWRSCFGVALKVRACRHGQLDEVVEALSLLVQQSSDVPPSLFYRVLKRCIAQRNLALGSRVHSLISASGHVSSTFLGNHIIRMYASCRMLAEATQVFDNLAVPDSCSWCYIIEAHAQQGHSTQALDFYRRMRGTAVKPSNYAFVAVLKACATAKDLVSGKEVHADILKRSEVLDVFVGTCLVDMYAKCGSLGDARNVFESLSDRDLVTWNTMLAAYTRYGLAQEAIGLYSRMQQETTIQADQFTYSCLLKANASIGALRGGKDIHSHIVERGLQGDVVLGNCLVDMYAKCGSLKDARKVFDDMLGRNVVTWNSMLAGYVQHGRGQEALKLYEAMQQEGITPANHVTYVCLLQACAATGALHTGMQLNVQIIERGLETDVVVGNCLVDMYAKCGSLEDARRVFDRLPKRDVVTWNAMLAGYVQSGSSQKALALYSVMQKASSTSPDRFTFACLLKACASVGDLDQGKQLHREICERGVESDVIVGNSLVDMYAKCGSLEDALKVFDKMDTKNVVTWNSMITGYSKSGRLEDAERMFDSLDKKDVLTWNAMIAAYVQHGIPQKALAQYRRMRQEGITQPDNYTFSCLLKACANLGALHQGKEIHSQILERQIESDVVVGHCLVDMYAKCGSIEDARRIFDNLPAKSVITWNVMFTGYTQHGCGQDALDLYTVMQQQQFIRADLVTYVCLLQACASCALLVPGKQLHAQIQDRGLENDEVIRNCLVDMYAKCGDLENARKLFDSSLVRSVVTWNAMMAGYIEQGLSQEALHLHASMPHHTMNSANQGTFVCLLKACTNVGALDLGKQLHLSIQQRGLEDDVMIGNCLIDMYTKCGRLELACEVFDKLPIRDVFTWTALLNGYAQNSNSKMAMQCFEDMRLDNVEPDSATFTSLLVACSKEGLVSEGQQYFRMMKDMGIAPTSHHQNCMVDLLGRAGYLEAAENMLQMMSTKDDVVGWKSLLNACKVHGDLERAKRCFDKLVEMEPQNATAYVLLADSYANAGRWKDAEMIEGLRRFGSAWKKPAMASVEVQSKVLTFTVGDERSDVSSKLQSVNLRLRDKGGRLPHTELVLKAVSVNDKLDALCGHAEKLALAYGLLNTPDGTPLFVTKNLRMCNSCHSGTKIMSKLEKREITVRDAYCVHRFVDGGTLEGRDSGLLPWGMKHWAPRVATNKQPLALPPSSCSPLPDPPTIPLSMELQATMDSHPRCYVLVGTLNWTRKTPPRTITVEAHCWGC